jgi:nucleotide-binding universal stress UspA family protein
MRILLAYDGREHSQPALEEAARIAAAEGASVTVLAVDTPDSSPGRYGYVAEPPHAVEDAAKAEAMLAGRGITTATKTTSGEAPDEILAEARAGGYDLLVTGSRGRGPIARTLMGSVSHRVAGAAPCPMLVVSEEHTVRIEPRAPAKA